MRNLQICRQMEKIHSRLQKYDADAHSQEIKDNFETMEGKKVSIAGRIMSKRVMGKASFCNVQDLQGNIQSYVARDCVGEEAYKDLRRWISVISWESKVRYSAQKWVRFRSMQRK